jgi:hypothetical protein
VSYLPVAAAAASAADTHPQTAKGNLITHQKQSSLHEEVVAKGITQAMEGLRCLGQHSFPLLFALTCAA